MKKLYGILGLAIVMVLLAGCYQGVVTSEMSITSIEGSGTKTIRCDIYKDHAQKPDGTGLVADNFSGDNPYFLKPIEDVVAFLNSKAPEGVVISMEEQPDKYVLSFTYSFENLAEYNAKTKALVGENLWTASEMSNAEIVVTQTENGRNIAFIEDIQVLTNSVRWAAEALLNDTTGVYNRERAAAEGLTGDGSTTSIFLVEKVKIDFLGKTETFDATATEIKVETVILDAVVEPVEETVPETTEQQDEAEATVENPETGDPNTILLFAFLLIGSALMLVFLGKRIAKN